MDLRLDMASRDYEWFVKADMGKYRGKYVIVKGRKVVASGTNLKELIRRFGRKYPGQTPIVTKIPKDEVLIWSRGHDSSA